MYRSITTALLLTTTAIFAQGSNGIPSTPNCATSLIGEFPTGVWNYNTIDCMTSATGTGTSNRELNLSNPSCLASACAGEQTTGGGNGQQIKPTPDPPITDLGAMPRPFSRWKQIQDEFLTNGCQPRGFSEENLRRLIGSKLSTSKRTNAEFQRIKASLPAFFEEYVKLSTRKEQVDKLARVNKRLSNIFEVRTKSRRGGADAHRGFDFPAQTELPEQFEVKLAPEAHYTKLRKFIPEQDFKGQVASQWRMVRFNQPTAKKNLGVVKVVDGEQTMYFQLVEISLRSQRKIRLGAQVQPPQDTKNVPTARFANNQLYSHQLVHKGEYFRATSRDPRKASMAPQK